ncbi:MAG: dephospho-CoA kinase [Propionibacterium sp.]|nr:dephospho-CoA kinase [Propionibacterium sp.]
MVRTALTGGIASGKSAVADMLRERGATIIDSDVLAREVVEPGTEGLRRVVERFGESILTPDGALDRAALGRVVFNDAAARADLNAITHPLVRERAVALEEAAEGLVIQVIPLLVEADLVDGFGRVIVVDVPEDVQLGRLMARDGSSRQEARSRIDAQAGREERLAVADHVLDNSGGPDETLRQVEALLPKLY